MRFLYSYQDKEGRKATAEVSASSLSDAYSDLRKNHIRPMKVWPKPGLINKFAGLGKRGLAIVALSILLVAVFSYAYTLRRAGELGSVVSPDVATPLPRQQIGHVAVKFKYETENVLQYFARPGDDSIFIKTGLGVKGVSSDLAIVLGDFEDSLKDPIRLFDADSDDDVVMKRVVAGLKAEARLLIESGEDQISVLSFFMARQKMECDHRKNALKNVQEDKESLENENAVLRAMGIRQITENEVGKNSGNRGVDETTEKML